MITDTDARRIASDWHGGQGTALYAFASTGAINTARADHDMAAEIADSIWEQGDRFGTEGESKEVTDLLSLDAYVNAHSDAHGSRGPVAGWSQLTR